MRHPFAQDVVLQIASGPIARTGRSIKCVFLMTFLSLLLKHNMVIRFLWFFFCLHCACNTLFTWWVCMWQFEPWALEGGKTF